MTREAPVENGGFVAAVLAPLALVACSLFAGACGESTLTGSSDLQGQNAYAKGVTGNFQATLPPPTPSSAKAPHEPPPQPNVPAPQFTCISVTTAYGAGVIDRLANLSATRGCGNDGDGWRVVNTDRTDTQNFYWWDIIGANFGTSRGTVQVGGQNAVIQVWTPNL